MYLVGFIWFSETNDFNISLMYMSIWYGEEKLLVFICCKTGYRYMVVVEDSIPMCGYSGQQLLYSDIFPIICIHLIISTCMDSFLGHLSRRLMWAFLIKICPLSVVVFVVVGVIVYFSHFHLLLQNNWANFNQTWHNPSLGEGDSGLFKWRALSLSKGR